MARPAGRRAVLAQAKEVLETARSVDELSRARKRGQTRLFFFLGRPTPFDAARRCPSASICSLNRPSPSPQPFSARSLPERAAWHNSR